MGNVVDIRPHGVRQLELRCALLESAFLDANKAWRQVQDARAIGSVNRTVAAEDRLTRIFIVALAALRAPPEPPEAA